MIKENVALFKEVIPSISKYASNAILLVVTNPVDILTYVTLKIAAFPSNRVIGSGTVGWGSLIENNFSVHRPVIPGDVVELEVEGIGILRNTVV